MKSASQSGRCVVLLVLSLMACVAAAQTGSGSKGNTGGTGDRKPPSPPAVVRRQPDNQQQRQNQQQRILFVSGIVVQDDGAALPSGIVIERNCNGRRTRESYADSAGRFVFQLGGNRTGNTLLPDASDSPEMDVMNSKRVSPDMAMPEQIAPLSLMGCELRAEAPGYRSTRVMLDALTSGGNVDVGTIVLYRLSRVQGTLVSASDMAAPKQARKAYSRFQKAVQQKDLAEAEKQVRAAVNIYPSYAAAWFGLGQVCQEMQRNEEARTAFLKALEVDSKYVGPYIHLARLAANERKWQEVADLTDHALELDPVDFVDGYFLNAAAHFYLHNLDHSERSARKTLQMDSFHRIPQIHLVLAEILQRKQDPAGAIEELRSYLSLVPAAPNAEQIRTQLQKLEQSAKPVATK